MSQHPDSESEEEDTAVPVDDAEVTFTGMTEALSKERDDDNHFVPRCTSHTIKIKHKPKLICDH